MKIIVTLLSGIVYEQTVIRAILHRSWRVQLIATLATSIVLTNLAIIVFGTQAKEVPTAAALLTPLYNIFPDMGALLTLKAFAAVIVGGFGYVQGAILASFLIGVTESLAAGYISYVYKDAFAFLIMIAVLLWRPEGLFGRRIGI
jgi:branched-chain amino acid transport system permease protein